MIRKQQARGSKRFQIGTVLAIAVAGVSTLAPRAMATTKDNNNTNLSLGASWVNGITPQVNGDVAIFDSTFATGNPALLLGGDVSWLGIQLQNPVQAVTVNAGNTLTLGASGIDTTQSAFALTLNPNIQLSGTGQTWNVIGPLLVGGNVNAGGGTLTLNTANTGATALVTGVISNGTVLVSGTGNATLSGNDSANQIVLNSGTTTLLGGKTVGSVTLNGGRLNIGAASAVGFGRLILDGGTFDNLSGAAMTLNTIPITLSGGVTFAGSNAFNSGLGTITVATASTLTLTNSVFTLGTPITTNFNFTVAGTAGVLNMTGVNSFGTSSTFTLAGGQLNINSTAMIQAGTFAINGGSFDVTNGSAMTYNTVPITFGGTSTFLGSQSLTLTGSVRLTANSNVTINNTVTFTTPLTGAFLLTKGGTGEMVFTASSNTFNNMTIGAGTLTIRNSQVINPAADIVGTTAGVPGVLNIDGGTLSANLNASPTVRVGNAAGALGSIRVSNNGVLTTANQFFIGGNNGGGYGALIVNSGIVSSGDWLVIGNNNDRGLLNMFGGSVTVALDKMTVGAGNSVSIGQVNILGGTFTAISATNGGIYIGELGTGVVTVSNALVVASNISLGQTATTLATFNMNTGSTLTLFGSLTKPTAGASGIMNIDGGTIKVVSTSGTNTLITGLTNVFVRSGGLTLDDQGYNQTIANALLAPTGSGLSSAGIVLGQTGFFEAPLVSISGYGGSGATARATIGTDGSLTGIVMTNAGIGYNSTVGTFTLLGGNGSGFTLNLTGVPTRVANASTGTFTKLGIGTDTLNLPGTIVGTTTVGGGTLTLNFAGSTGVTANWINALSPLALSGGALNINSAGATQAGNRSQTFASTTIGSGPSADNISVVNGGTNNFVLNLGAITRNGLGSEVVFTLPLGGGVQSSTNGITTTTANTDFTGVGGKQSILGGWATVATASGVVSSWAISGAAGTNSGNITALTAFSSTFAAGQDVDAPTGATAVGGPLTINSLRLNTPGSYAIDATGGLTIASGGIMYTGNDTTSGQSVAISNGTIASAQPELFVAQFNTVNAMTIGSTIAATALVKTGGGLLSLTNTANNISGKTVVYGGVLGLAADASLGNAPGGVIANQLTLSGGGIQFQNQFNLSSNRGIFLGSTATIDTNGFNTTYGGIISGALTAGLTKLGAGTLTLTNAETYIGPTTVTKGTLDVSGGVISGQSVNAFLTIANVSGSNAVLAIDNGGVVNAQSSTTVSVRMGSANAAGAIYVNSGTLTTIGNGSEGEFFIGNAETGYGALMIGANGDVNAGNWIGLGRTGGQGYLSMTGGSLFLTGGNLAIGSDYTSGNNVNVPHGVADFAGNAVATINGLISIASPQSGYMSVRGNANVNTNSSTNLFTSGQTTSTQAYLNLVGGTLTTTAIIVTPSTQGAHTALLNFNGGTLKARANSGNFINFTNTGQTAFSAILYNGGGTIDDGGNAITVSANFISASGNGVDPTGLTFSGSGFIAPPLVQIGGGGGVGATAIANLDGSGNITGLTMTNPGTGYTSAAGLTFTFIGGGATASAIGTATLVANATTGAFNKAGLGTLTLSGSANNYGGQTNLNQGTTIISGTMGGLGGVSVASGAVLRMGGGNMGNPVTINSGGSLSGVGLISNIVSIASGGALDLGSGPSGAGAAGTLTLSGNLAIDATTAPAIMRFDYEGAGNGTNGSSDTLALGANSINVNGTNPIVVFLNALQITAPFQTEVLATYGGTNPNVLIDPNSSRAGFNTVSLASSGGSITLTTFGKASPINAYWTGNFGNTWTALDSLLFNDNFNDAAVGGANTNQYPSQASTVIFTANTTNSSFATTLGSVNFDIKGLVIQNASAVSIGGTSTLTLEGSGIINGATAGGVTISAPVVLGTGQTWTNLSTASNINVTGIVSGASTNALTIVGNVRLAGANTFTGGAIIGAGTLTTANAGALASRALTFTNGQNGHLELAGVGLTVGALNGDSTAVIEDNSNTSATLTFNNSINNSTFGGVIQNGTATGVLSLLVTGGGTLTTTGNNAYTGATTVRSGNLNITAGTITSGTGVILTVGDTAGFNGILTVNGGTILENKTTRPSISVGSTASTSGVVRMISGTITTGGEFWLGADDNGAAAYAGMSMSGGSVTAGNWFVLGFNNDRAVFNLSGGTFTQLGDPTTVGAGGTNGMGVFNISGGTYVSTAFGMYLGEVGTGILNISGNAQFIVANPALSGLRIAPNANSTGFVNLNGGTLAVDQISKAGGTTAVGIFNFNGGTLAALSNSINFLPNTLNRATIWGGGAVIDVNNTSSVVSNVALLAPTGSGVATIPVTASTTTNATAASGATILVVASNSGLTTGMTIVSNSTSIPAGATITAISGNAGTSSATITLSAATTASVASGASLTLDYEGFLEAPVIRITGTGTGASAIGTIDTNGKLTSITITNPGVGYTAPPTVTAVGNFGSGFGVAGLTLPLSTIVANGTGAGLTLHGTGTLTLAGVGSTYTGDTVVGTGVLALGANNGFAAGSVLRVFNTGIVTGTAGTNSALSTTIGGLDSTLGTPGQATGFGTMTISVAAGKSYLFGGLLTTENLTKAGDGVQTMSGSGVSFTDLNLNDGNLILTNGVNVSSGGSLTLGGTEATLQLTLGSGGTNIITLGTVGARTSGATGNIVLTDGTNGATNGLALTSAPSGLIDQGTFFNGADYAMVDPSTKFVRAPVYGTDATFSAADALNSGTNVLVSSADVQALSASFTTVKLSGGVASLAQGGNLLSTLGILKSGGGAATISGGSLQAINGGSTASGDFVVRVDGSDTLTITSAILDNGGTSFVKSGSGVLVLGNANTFSGKLDLLNGTLVVANASALQNSLVSLISGQGTIQFATGTNTAVFGGLTSPTNNGTLTLQDQSAAPVNVIVQISDSPTLALSGDGFSRINVMNGLITGSGSLTIVSNNTDGRYDFNTANTFAGGVTILSGRVQANQQILGSNGTSNIGTVDSSLGTGLITLNGGTLTTHGSGVAVTFNNNFAFNGSASFNTASASNATLNGNISGTGTVVRGGTGTLVFNGTGNSGFAGTFVNTAGNVTFNSLGAVPGAGASFNFTNAAAIAVNSSVSGPIAFGSLAGIAGANMVITNTNTSTGNSLTSTLQIGALGATTTFAGNITSVNTNANNGYIVSLQKLGGGTLTLQGTASNFYDTTVAAGTLAVTSLDNGAFSTAASSTSLTTMVLASATGIANGVFVTGSNVKPGTTIASFTGTTITLSAPLSASNNTVTAVQLLTANALGVAGAVTIAGNATLQYAGGTATSVKTFVLGNNAALDASGAGAVTYSNTASPVWSTAGVPSTLVLTGTGLATNTLAAQLGDNGAGSVTLVKSGTGVWALSNSANSFTGGMLINGGTLLLANNNSVGNSGGASFITVNSSGALGGTGGTTTAITVNSGGQISPGPVTGNHVGTLFVGGPLNLTTGSILNIDLAGPGLANDVVSMFGSGSLTMTGGTGSVGVNLLNAGLNSSYFFNGTYNIFTGLSAGNATALAGQIGALHTLNEDTTSGATFTFSLATGAVNNLLLTVAGGWNSANWSNANNSNIWSDAGDWVGGVPNGSGHVATFGTLVAAGGTLTTNGNKSINRLVFSNTNSYTINPTSPSDTLFIENGTTNVATIVVQSGSHFINTAMQLDAGTTSVAMSGGTSLTLGGNVTGAGSLSITGSGVVVLTGNTNPGGGTSVVGTSILQVGNGGNTGAIAGQINLLGILKYNRSDSVTFDVNNFVQLAGSGTLTQSGTGTLSLMTSGRLFDENLRVESGTVKLLQANMMDANNGTRGNFEIMGTGRVDLNGFSQDVRGLFNEGDPVGGVLDNSSATPVLLGIHSGAAHTFTGTITNSGGGALSILKDNAGGILTLTGLVNNTGSITLTGGQIVYTNTASSTLGGLIVMGRSTTGSTGLILGNGVTVTTPILVTVGQGANEFVGSDVNASATFSGNVTVDPAAAFNPAVQVVLGNINGATGSLTFSGGTITIPVGTKGLVSRNTVTLTGTERVDSQDTGNPFQIGLPGNAVTLISGGNSTLQTDGGDFSFGLTLGSTGNTANTIHTIQDSAIVKIGVNGGGLYDLQPSTSSTSSNTLNLNGGSLLLGEFSMTGAQAGAGSPGAFPQANVVFNGGAIVAGLNFTDIAPSFGPSNMKFTIGAGGMTLDLNQKSGVQFSKQLTSASSGTAFSDGGLAYISSGGPGTITLATRQLYKGATTIGRNAVVIAASNDVLGDPSVGAAVNFAGGTLAMTGNLALSLQDGGTTNLTHRYSFNSSDPMFDSVVGFDNGNLSLNATASGGKILMSGMANSSQSSTLNVFDINGSNYATSGATFLAWYTTNPTATNSYVFSIGGTGAGGGYQYLMANANSGGNFRAFISAGGNVTTNGAGTEINAQGAAPSNNVEHQMAITIDNSNISLYLDGALVQTTPLTTAAGGELLQSIIDNGILLGGSTYPADPSFNGSVDEFRIYNTVLSQQYIAASFNASADTLAPVVSVSRNITVANSTVSGASNGVVDLAGFELDVGGNITGAGTLTLQDGGSLVLTGNSSAGLVINSNVQVFVGTGGSLGALTGGNVSNAGKITINRNDTSSIWGANISGAGTITHVGTGTTSVTASNNTYTGPLLINAGKLLIGANGTVGSLSPTGPITLAGILGYNRSDNGLVVAAPISGGGTVTQVGSGITSVTGNNSYTGGTIFANGELEVDSANAIGTTGTLSFTGGALRYSATNTSDYQSRFSTAANQLYAFDTNGQTITFTQPLNSSGNSALTKLGAGTLILTSTNNYLTTNVNGGVLQVNNGAALGSGNINFGGPGTLAMNRSGSNIVGNTLSGFGGTFSQVVGTSIITGTNTFSGGFNIASGATLQVGNGAGVGDLGFAGVSNAGLLNINRTGLLTIAGPVSGGGTITHSGSGTTTLTGTYSASGPVNVNAGQLAFGTTAGARQTPAIMLNMKSLSIASNASIDMTNHDLLVGNSNLTTVNNEILAGFGIGLPGDPAITSSTALSNGTTFMVPIDADALLGDGSPGSAITQTWDNVAITQPGTIIVKYTYFGDVTLDGQVDNLDFAVAASSFGHTTPGLANIEQSWLLGDVTLDGVVDNLDFASMASNFGFGVGNPLGSLDTPAAASGGGSTSAVPEPASLALLGIGAAGLLLRRKKR